MEESRLIALIKQYEQLRALKEELKGDLTDIEEEYKKVQSEIVETMVEEDVPSQGYGGFNYSPQTVTHYSFRAKEALEAEGIDKIQVMKKNKFGFLVKEDINQKSLESALKDYVKNDPDVLLEHHVEW